MRYLVATHRPHHGFGAEISKLDERARKERKPDVYRYKTENVIKGQYDQLFKRSVVMLFYQIILLYYIIAVGNLTTQLFCSVSANLYAFARSRRHNEQPIAEFVFFVRLSDGQDVACHYGANGKRCAVAYYRHGVHLQKRFLQYLVR